MNGANPDVGVEGEISNSVKSAWIFSAQPREPGGSDTGNPDLAAVGVPGKLKVDWPEGGYVGEVGLMRQQYDSLSGRNFGYGGAQVGMTVQCIVDPSKPEPGRSPLDGESMIQHHWNSMSLQGTHNTGGIRPGVVITENGKLAGGRAEFLQDLGAGRDMLCCPPGAGAMVIEQGNGNEVSGESDQIGMQIVHNLDRFAQGHRREIIFVMEIAELRNGEAVECGG